MRLLKVERKRVMLPLPDEDTLIGLLDVRFSVNGTEVTVSLALPEEWDTWDRPTKIAWAKQEIASRAAENRYRSADELVFPDVDAQDQAVEDILATPGWASWDADQVEAYIREHAIDFPTLLDVVVRMGRLMIHLRDAAIEK